MSGTLPMLADAEEATDNLPILLPGDQCLADDEPSVLEQLLARRVVQYGTALATVSGLIAAGLGAEWVLPLGTLALGVPRLWLAMAFGRHFRRGLYRRSLFVTTRLLDLSWWWRDSFIWQLNQ